MKRWLTDNTLLLAFIFVLMLPLTGCGSQHDSTPTVAPTGKALASWDEQLAAAQAEATKIDSKAVLDWVLSGYTVDQLIQRSPVTVYFVFQRPNGERIAVDVRDTAPPKIIEVVPKFDNSN